MAQLKTQVVTKPDAAECDKLLLGSQNPMIYASSVYREFLGRLLPGCEPLFIEARQLGRLVGYLSAYTCRTSIGTVANSQPFYGSHGGPVVLAEAEDGAHIAASLIAAFESACCEQDVSAATVIESPFYLLDSNVTAVFAQTHFDERVSQISSLPGGFGREQVEQAILAQCHQKTRNLIRKAQKSGFTIKSSSSMALLKDVQRLHAERMATIGGVAKPYAVLEALAATLDEGRHWRLWTAHKDGRLAAGLLVLEYDGIIEYFVPVFHPDFRSEQPLSAIIFEAMCDAAVRGFKSWNWGGTWLAQDEVYRFKSRWGAVDRRYRYFIRVFKPEILRRSREDLLSQFPYFYVAPFSALQG